MSTEKSSEVFAIGGREMDQQLKGRCGVREVL